MNIIYQYFIRYEKSTMKFTYQKMKWTKIIENLPIIHPTQLAFKDSAKQHNGNKINPNMPCKQNIEAYGLKTD